MFINFINANKTSNTYYTLTLTVIPHINLIRYAPIMNMKILIIY